jgi:hypothetical protein
VACEDRQLSQAQREEGFQNQRTGVQQAVRPFTGAPTVDNLIDYINRELFPAVKATRKAANDIYLQVADNAPSANPLGYYFSTETAAADPTAGRVRLNASPQSSSTNLAISQTNGRLVDVLPWLDVMNGSVTEPLGVVTLADAINPGRFLRADLDGMTDQGAYWDLAITITEASHPDPFVDSEAVTLAFIPGVADNEGIGAQIPPDSITPIATDTFLGNISGASASPVAVPLASVDSTSVAYDGTAHEFRRAALTGAITAALNTNATLFAGIRDNGSAETDRTNLNFVSSNDITFTVTDDAANDELEITATLAPLVVTPETVGGTFTDYALPADTDVWDFTATSTISSVAGGTSGRRLVIRNGAAAGSGVTVTILQFSGGTAGNRFLLTKATTHVLHPGDALETQYISSRWQALEANRALYRTNSSGLGTSRGRVNYVDSTSITYSNADVAADDEVTISPRRAALTGAIAASANSNATTFAGILDNGSAENDRTSLNFLTTTSIVAVVTDDAVNDELELTYQRAALTGFAEAAQNSNATTSAEPIVTYSASANMTAERVTTSSTSITVSTAVASQIEFQRAALTGAITAGANSNATLFDTNASGAGLTGGGTAIMAVGAGTGITVNANDVAVTIPLTDGDKGDITVATSGTSWTIDASAVTTTKIADANVTLAKLANLAAGTVIGRQIDAGTGVPVALTGGELAENIRWANITTEAVGGTFTDHALDMLTDVWLFTATSTVTGIAGGTAGKFLRIYNGAAAGSGVTVTLVQFATSLSGNRFLNRDAANIVLDPGGTATYYYESSRWRNYGVAGASAISDSDKGDITVSASGKTWTIDAGVVTLAKQANLAQSTIVGRSEGAGTGVPEALTPTQVVSIIDGESPTWTASHRFNSFIQFGTSTGLPVTGDIRKAGAMVIESAGSLTLEAGGTVVIEAVNDLSVTVADEINIVANNDISIDSGAGVVSITSLHDGSVGAIVQLISRGPGASPVGLTGHYSALWSTVPVVDGGDGVPWLIHTDENGYANNMTVSCGSHMAAPATVSATTTTTTQVTMNTPSSLEMGMCWHLHAASTVTRGATATAVGFELSAFVNSTARFTVSSALNTTNGYEGTATIDVYLTIVDVTAGIPTWTVTGVGHNTILSATTVAETSTTTFTTGGGANGISARTRFSAGVAGTSYTTVQGTIVRIR